MNNALIRIIRNLRGPMGEVDFYEHYVFSAARGDTSRWSRAEVELNAIDKTRLASTIYLARDHREGEPFPGSPIGWVKSPSEQTIQRIYKAARLGVRVLEPTNNTVTFKMDSDSDSKALTLKLHPHGPPDNQDENSGKLGLCHGLISKADLSPNPEDEEPHTYQAACIEAVLRVMEDACDLKLDTLDVNFVGNIFDADAANIIHVFNAVPYQDALRKSFGLNPLNPFDIMGAMIRTRLVSMGAEELGNAIWDKRITALTVKVFEKYPHLIPGYKSSTAA